MRLQLHTLGTFIICSLSASWPAFATCPEAWLQGGAVQGLAGSGYASTLWDPDGGGPLTPRLAIAGDFKGAGNQLAKRVTTFDPATGQWSDLGGGLNDRAFALGTLPDGSLVVGGVFTEAGGIPASRIARWNGAWSVLGIGVNGPVFAMTTLPNGDLIVGGSFTQAGGVPANNIARWNGTAWSSFGSGTLNGAVYSLLAQPNGEVVVGGAFTTVGGGPNDQVNNIARWTGSSWARYGSGITVGVSGAVFSLARLSSGELVVGGNFTLAGGVPMNRVARWTGTTWQPFGTGATSSTISTVWDLEPLPGNQLLMAGEFINAGGLVVRNVARWNGSSWSDLGGGTSAPVRSLTTLPDGQLAVVGDFSTAGTVAAGQVRTQGVARWTGSAWSDIGASLGAGSAGSVLALATAPNGQVFAGGNFSRIASITGVTNAARIARWDGATWFPLGTGMNADVLALAVRSNGNAIAGGIFSQAGGVFAPGIAEWNGSSWSNLGTGPGAIVRAILADGTDLIASGVIINASGSNAGFLARWNGTTWVPFAGGTNAPPNAIARMSDGSIVITGGFSSVGSPSINAIRIARWNGSAWSPLGGGLDGDGFALLPLPSGELIAGGEFTSAGGVFARSVARWNGSTWNAMGGGLSGDEPVVRALTRLESGDIVAGGNFSFVAGVQAAPNAAVWNGTTWAPLGGGVDAPIFALDTSNDGAFLYAGGSFALAGESLSASFAVYGIRNDCFQCDSIDFNNDGITSDPTDIEAFLSVYSGGPCIPAQQLCNDVDFNNDGIENDPTDIESFLSVYSGGPCF